MKMTNEAQLPVRQVKSDPRTDELHIDIIISAVIQRTGSTLLQRICNARKENLIWGEHGGIVTNFCGIEDINKLFSVKSESERKQYFGSGENPNNMIANMTPEVTYVENAVIRSIRKYFTELYAQYRAGHDIIGFKEVRYGERELKLLRRCYPESKILLLIRNPIDIWKSFYKIWAKDIPVGTLVNIWKERTTFYIKFDRMDENSFLIKYEDLVQRHNPTLNLISAIARVSIDEIDQVLSNKLFSTKHEISREDEDFIRQHCGELMTQLGY